MVLVKPVQTAIHKYAIMQIAHNAYLYFKYNKYITYLNNFSSNRIKCVYCSHPHLVRSVPPLPRKTSFIGDNNAKQREKKNISAFLFKCVLPKDAKEFQRIFPSRVNCINKIVTYFFLLLLLLLSSTIAAYISPPEPKKKNQANARIYTSVKWKGWMCHTSFCAHISIIDSTSNFAIWSFIFVERCCPWQPHLLCVYPSVFHCNWAQTPIERRRLSQGIYIDTVYVTSVYSYIVHLRVYLVIVMLPAIIRHSYVNLFACFFHFIIFI